MKFPVALTHDKVDGGFVVTFRDIPEAITQGETEEEALHMAKEALETALEFYFEDARTVPIPTNTNSEELTVELSASLSAKVLLLNEMLDQNVRPQNSIERFNFKTHNTG